jgi:RNA polymerase sigma-70 factor (ECF subfamily)
MHPPLPEPTLSTVASDAGSDVELALQASAGNAIAFETIVRRHNRLLFRTARGVVADDAEAQDVVQETYLRAFANLRSYRGDASLGTWLARIAINLALATLRKQGRLVQWEEGANPEDGMSDEITEDEAPHAMAERGEMRLLLQASIEDLPIIYRSVFMLRAVQEMTVEETAYCLGVSQDVVKTRFLRARAMLREALSTRIESGARDTFAFAGERCDAVLAHVMAELLRRRLVRLH